MKYQQLIRIDKVNNDELYLLSKSYDGSKFCFDVCGSTKNIYNIKLYNNSKMIFCNCPDARGYAKRNGVICKHSCFILLKVLKLDDISNYFSTLIFTDEQLSKIKEKYEALSLVNNECVNEEYITKYQNIKNKSNDIIINKEREKECCICYDELVDITNKDFNAQCHHCDNIFHKSCITKWINMGNTNCPYCRGIINTCQTYKTL